MVRKTQDDSRGRGIIKGNPPHDIVRDCAYISFMTRAPQQASLKAPIFAILLSGGLLIGAWIFQYGFGYLPCTMCYWQRHAHKAVLIIAAITIGASLYKPQFHKLFTALIILALLVSAGIAFWHVGVEYKWWDGPKTCAGGGDLSTFDLNDPLGSLDKKIRPPACTEAVWHFLGLSMAAWNTIASLCGAVIIGTLLKRGHNHD